MVARPEGYAPDFCALSTAPLIVFPWDYELGRAGRGARRPWLRGGSREQRRAIVVGTAGHIDHGKTALVQALTGIDTDRLARGEAARHHHRARASPTSRSPAGRWRAWWTCRATSASSAPWPRARAAWTSSLLVVAADEGVMPQTREHLDICRLLGVSARRGGGHEERPPARPGSRLAAAARGGDPAALPRAPSSEGAPDRARCSARTGDGAAGAARRAAPRSPPRSPQRPADGPLLLPVDRAFSLKGFGTVVTGTILSGTIAGGRALALLPASPAGARSGRAASRCTARRRRAPRRGSAPR